MDKEKHGKDTKATGRPITDEEVRRLADECIRKNKAIFDVLSKI